MDKPSHWLTATTNRLRNGKILQILQFQFEGLVDFEIPQSRIAPLKSFKVNGLNNYNNYHNMQMVAALVPG